MYWPTRETERYISENPSVSAVVKKFIELTKAKIQALKLDTQEISRVFAELPNDFVRNFNTHIQNGTLLSVGSAAEYIGTLLKIEAHTSSQGPIDILDEIWSFKISPLLERGRQFKESLRLENHI